MGYVVKKVEVNGLPQYQLVPVPDDAAAGRMLSRVLVLLAVAVAVLCAALAMGCSGVSPATYCYTAVSATVHTVDTGMKVAGDLYRAGKLSEDAKNKLIASHDVYRPLAKAAVDGCRAVSDQGQADKVIADIMAASSHVIEGLVAAGAK